MFISLLIEWCLEIMRVVPDCASVLVVLGIVSLVVGMYVTYKREQGQKDSDLLRAVDGTLSSMP